MEEKGTEMDMTNKIYDFFPEQHYNKTNKTYEYNFLFEKFIHTRVYYKSAYVCCTCIK